MWRYFKRKVHSPEESSRDKERGSKSDLTLNTEQSFKQSRVDFNVLPVDPGERQKRSDYDPDDRGEVRRCEDLMKHGGFLPVTINQQVEQAKSEFRFQLNIQIEAMRFLSSQEIPFYDNHCDPRHRGNLLELLQSFNRLCNRQDIWEINLQ